MLVWLQFHAPALTSFLLKHVKPRGQAFASVRKQEVRFVYQLSDITRIGSTQIPKHLPSSHPLPFKRLFLSLCFLFLQLGLFLYLICLHMAKAVKTPFTFSNPFSFSLSSLFHLALISHSPFLISCFIYHRNRTQWYNGLFLSLNVCTYSFCVVFTVHLSVWVYAWHLCSYALCVCTCEKKTRDSCLVYCNGLTPAAQRVYILRRSPRK